jgi:hypothetical protein
MAGTKASHSGRGPARRRLAWKNRVRLVLLGGAGLLSGVAVLSGVTVVAARRRLGRRSWWPGFLRRPDGRWHSVTVNRRPEEVSTAVGPAPLAELGLEVDLRYRPAPGGRGTEVSVRAPHGSAAQQREIRTALRQAKQLWETGEVLQPDELGRARRTSPSRPRAYATRAGREDGRP